MAFNMHDTPPKTLTSKKQERNILMLAPGYRRLRYPGIKQHLLPENICANLSNRIRLFRFQTIYRIGICRPPTLECHCSDRNAQHHQ